MPNDDLFAADDVTDAEAPFGIGQKLKSRPWLEDGPKAFDFAKVVEILPDSGEICAAAESGNDQGS